MGLTNKQQAFVDAYLVCFNATKAAEQAGYSRKSARQMGSENLSKPAISARIRERMNEAAMTADEVLYHLAQIVRADLEDVIDGYGNLDLDKARELGKTRMIKRVKQRKITSEDQDIFETEVELHDPMKALDLLAKHHNLTNTLRVDDWRSQAIKDIRDGKLTFAALREAFDYDLATELFRASGVPVSAEQSEAE